VRGRVLVLEVLRDRVDEVVRPEPRQRRLDGVDEVLEFDLRRLEGRHRTGVIAARRPQVQRLGQGLQSQRLEPRALAPAADARDAVYAFVEEVLEDLIQSVVRLAEDEDALPRVLQDNARHERAEERLARTGRPLDERDAVIERAA